MKYHLNMSVVLIFSLGQLSLFLHYYEYLCDRGQPYMKVFLMMSGQITKIFCGRRGLPLNALISFIFQFLLWVLCTADITFTIYLLSFSGKLTIFYKIRYILRIYIIFCYFTDNNSNVEFRQL